MKIVGKRDLANRTIMCLLSRWTRLKLEWAVRGGDELSDKELGTKKWGSFLGEIRSFTCASSRCHLHPLVFLSPYKPAVLTSVIYKIEREH